MITATRWETASGEELLEAACLVAFRNKFAATIWAMRASTYPSVAKQAFALLEALGYK